MLASDPTIQARHDAERSPLFASSRPSTRASSLYTQRSRSSVRAFSQVVTMGAALSLTACAGMTPQLPPTDVAALSTISDRAERETAYSSNQIYTHHEPQGVRYTKGTDPDNVKRSWRSLDAVLRSDANSAAALPDRKLRTSRVLATLAVASGIVAVSGFAASARNGLDLSRLEGGGAMLLGGSIATIVFAVASGVVYGRARTDYARAVEIYNDSLGMRMGLYTPAGQYIPADNVLVDEEGFIILSTPEDALVGPQPAPKAASDPSPVGPATPQPVEPAPSTTPPPTDPTTAAPSTSPSSPPPVQGPSPTTPPPASTTTPPSLPPATPDSSPTAPNTSPTAPQPSAPQQPTSSPSGPATPVQRPQAATPTPGHALRLQFR